MEYGEGNSIFNWLPQIRSKNIFERAQAKCSSSPILTRSCMQITVPEDSFEIQQMMIEVVPQQQCVDFSREMMAFEEELLPLYSESSIEMISSMKPFIYQPPTSICKGIDKYVDTFRRHRSIVDLKEMKEQISFSCVIEGMDSVHFCLRQNCQLYFQMKQDYDQLWCQSNSHYRQIIRKAGNTIKKSATFINQGRQTVKIICVIRSI